MKRRKFISNTLLATVPVSLTHSKVANFLTNHIDIAPFVNSERSDIAPSILYDQMAQICATKSMGCAINTRWMIAQTASILNSSTVSAFMTNLNLQTSNPKIGVGIKIDPNLITLTVRNNVVHLDGFSPVLVFKEITPNGGVFNTIDITYNSVKLLIDFDSANPDRLRFYLDEKKPGFQIPDKTGQMNAPVVNRNFPTTDEFLRIQDIFLFSTNAIALLDAFVASIQFPPILQSAKTFTLQAPYQYSFTSEYIIIHSKFTDISPKDDCGGADGFRVDAKLKQNPTANGDGTGNIQFDYQRKLTSSVVTTDRLVPAQQNLEGVDFAFYYPTSITFQPLIGNTLTPAVAIGDKGSFLAFEWFYKLTANLSSGAPVIKIDLQTKSLSIDFPIELLGAGGLGMTIACVYVPICHGMITGDVNPNHIKLTLELTVDGNGIALYAKPDYNASAHIQFQDFLHLEAILNFLMGSIGNRLISNALKDRVNKLNFKLFDFTDAQISSKYGWFFSSLAKSDSFFAGFKTIDG